MRFSDDRQSNRRCGGQSYLMIHVQYWTWLLAASFVRTSLDAGCWGLQQRKRHLLPVHQGGLDKTSTGACLALQERPGLHCNLC